MNHESVPRELLERSVMVMDAAWHVAESLEVSRDAHAAVLAAATPDGLEVIATRDLDTASGLLETRPWLAAPDPVVAALACEEHRRLLMHRAGPSFVIQALVPNRARPFAGPVEKEVLGVDWYDQLLRDNCGWGTESLDDEHYAEILARHPNCYVREFTRWLRALVMAGIA